MSYGKASDDFQPWTLPLEESTKMIAHALDLGVNFFDTANCYSHGTSEEYLGAALKSLGVARDKVVLASKVYFNDGHLSKDAIAREIEGTLRRLGTDYLDLYQIHRFDYATPIEETKGRSGVSGRIIWTCTRSTVSTTRRRSKKRWRRWTSW